MAAFGWLRALAVAGFLAAAVCAAYSNSFGVPFHFDDFRPLTSPSLRDFWNSWRIIPTRPFLGFSLGLSYQLGGGAAYHVMNLAFHVLAGCVLFGLLRRTLAGPRLRERFGRMSAGLALGIALLWVLHPLQTQAVTYIIQRGESLASLFYLLVLYCVVRGHDSPWVPLWWTAALVCCVLGLATKEIVVTAPVMVGLYYWTFLPDTFERGAARRWWWYAEIGFLAALAVLCAAAAVVALFYSGHMTAGFEMRAVSPYRYALTQPGVLLRYLRLAVWPADLCVDYAWPMASSFSEVWPQAAGIALLLAATAWGVVRRSVLGFLGAWFFVILAPTSSFMPIADAAVEHRMYLPLAALVALLVAGVHLGLARLAAATERGEAERRRLRDMLTCGLVLVLAVPLGILTFRRNEDYRDEVTLWTDVLAKRPANPRAYENVGSSLGKLATEKNSLEYVRQALPYLKKAVELKPDYGDAHCNLGVAYAQLGDHPAAAAEYEMALRINPRDYGAHLKLGNALYSLKRFGDAEKQYRETIAIRSDHPDAHGNLGAILAAKGQYEEARQEYELALHYKPDLAEAHCNLANLLMLLGKNEEALPHYREALRLKPGYTAAEQGIAKMEAPGP